MNRKLVTLAVFLLAALALLVAPVAAQDRPDLLIWADRTRAPVLTTLAEQFTTDYGLTVVVQEIGLGDIRANIGVAGPAGEGPDIIVAVHDWIGELVLNGSVVPLDLGDKAADFTPASLALFTYSGQLYGMPYAVENVAFFRNPDLVPDAPATWDDVATITRTLVDGGTTPYGYLIQTSDFYHFHGLFSAFGGYVFGRDADGNYDPNDVGLDSPGALAAGAYLNDLARGGYLPSGIDYDSMHTLFEQGEAAMMITGPWALPRLRQANATYAISDIPAGPAGPGMPFIGGQGFMLSAYSEKQVEAQLFLLDFMATEDNMRALYDADPRPPAYAPLLAQLDDPDLAAFQQAGLAGIPQPSIPQMTSVWGSAASAMQQVIQGDTDPDSAFMTAGEQIRTLIAGGTLTPPTSAGGDTPPADGPQTVSIPGTVQSAAGCPGDWDPACPDTQLMYNANSDVWMNTFTLPAGSYEYKVALNGTWDENYGGMADRDGANIKLELADETAVTFIYDHKTNWVADSVNRIIASVPGSFQDEIGCSGDWSPDCLRSWLQDVDGDGIYTFSTDAIPAGDYEAKVALNMTWDVNYGADGARDGANLAFTVPADGTVVTFSFDSTTNVLTITVGE